MQFFSREDIIWIGRRGGGFGYCWGGAWFCGAHTLPSLDHVSFERFVRVRKIFGGVCVCEAWKWTVVSGRDGRYPILFQWESGGGMEVSDEWFHAWDAVITVGFRCGGCLQWWLRLGVWQEGESPEPGACDLSPSAWEHWSDVDKDCERWFVVYHRAAFVT